MALKDLVFTAPTKREIDAAELALDSMNFMANRNMADFTRAVAETALTAAAIERSHVRYEAKKRIAVRGGKQT